MGDARAVVRLCLVVAVMCAATSAGADDKKAEAKRHFDAGVKLYEAEDYASAATEFETSLATFPTKMGYFNLANCYKALHRYGDALGEVDALERRFGGELDAQWRSDIKELRSGLRSMVGEIRVAVGPSGATVALDGQDVGAAPLAKPLLVAPGKHLVAATAAGYATESREVMVTAQSETQVTLSLERPAAEPPATAAAPPPRAEMQPPPAAPPAPANEGAPRAQRLSAWFWTGLGLTVVLGGVSGGMYGAASSQAKKYDSTMDDFDAANAAVLADPTDTNALDRRARLYSDLTDERDKVHAFADAGLGLAIGAGAAAVATIVIVSVELGKRGGEADGGAAVSVVPAPGGVAVEF